MLSSSSALPRNISKWLQTIPVSIEGGFENGKVFGEILAFYHPQTVDLSNFQNGKNLNAKRNNFMILERLFAEFGIEVSREDFLRVAQGDTRKATSILELIQSHGQGLVSRRKSRNSCLKVIAQCLVKPEEIDNFSVECDWDAEKIKDIVGRVNIDSSELMVRLENVKEELAEIMRSEHEIDLVFDAFIPLFISNQDIHSSTSKTITAVLTIFGQVLNETKSINAYNRIRISKHFNVLISAIESERGFFVIQVLNEYIGVEEEKLAEILCELKTLSTLKGFLSLIAGLLHFRGTLTNKSAITLIVREISTIKPQSLAGLQEDYFLYIMRMIVRCKIQSNMLRLVGDCISNFFLFLDRKSLNCIPNRNRKVYVGLLCEIAKTDSFGAETKTEAILRLAKCIEDSELTDLNHILIMISPLLKTIPQLSLKYVLGILRYCRISNDVEKLLQCKKISLGLPLFPDEDHLSILDSWNPFGITIGIIEMLHSAELSNRSIALLMHSIIELPRNVSDMVYIQLYCYLFASLGTEETSQQGWDLFLLFITRCSSDVIISVWKYLTQKFHSLLAVLVYTHTLENTKCRRRLMGRLRKLSDIDPRRIDSADRFSVLKNCSTSELLPVQGAAQMLLEEFKRRFSFKNSKVGGV